MERKIGWALVGTGSIARKFCVGLRAAEGVGPVCAVSRTAGNAEAFAREYGLDRGYGSLAAALDDPAVDVVYVGTPHSTHREIALAAIAAGKAVLCEKPVAIAAWEMEEMAAAARAKGTFFMEAMWTRFMPAIKRAAGWIAEGQIGRVKLVQANFGFVTPWLPEARLLNPLLGGGALLDAGIYPISMAFMAFAGREAEAVHGMLTIGETRVDEQFMGLISFGGDRMASVNAAIRTSMQSDAWIYGDQGRIRMRDFVFGHEASLQVDGRFDVTYAPDVRGNGYTYEAEEVMRCVREGRTESAVMPMAETIRILRVMDEIRRQAGFAYPFEKR
ncbi:MAG: Gfo/Idh/MocA family oxidoreductase [Clostridiales bacterium]|nr:Gfo/Idh/MocA family oxidoreductase [Clostridiales bacterium]